MGLNPFRREVVEAERDQLPLSFDAFLGLVNEFSYQGLVYQGLNQTLPQAKQESGDGTFASFSRLGYKTNAVVFACIDVRTKLFKQARFQFRNRITGKEFTTNDLRLLEKPWPGARTSDLLSRVIQHADLAGNAFVARRGERLMVLRPDWVTIVAGNTSDEDASIWSPDTELIGYIYNPGGAASNEPPIMFTPDEVAHFAPIPDPEARFRGMSWLTPVIRELMADKAMTEHRLAFFENAATPNLVVKLDVPDLEKFKKWIQTFRDDHEGATNAYKTLYLGAGADATVVGKDLQQIDFKVVQGAGETRIAAAAGVPPVIVGLSEGLAAATYSNYGQARRRFNDGTMWPLWQDVAESLETIINVPGGAELCVDGDCIPALREDQADAATIQATQAQTIKALTDAGYEWNSVVQAVTGEDFTQLAHTGLYSVQLQPPGTQEPPSSGSTAIPAINGSQGRALAALERVATAGKEE